MAAATITAAMTAIETRLKTISGLRTAPFVPSQINPPQAYVSVPTIPHYHGAFAHGKFQLDFTVVILISKAMDRIDQPALALYADIAGSKSVHAAIEGDRTLGGSVDDCIVVAFREADVELGGIKWYSGVFTLQVVASGA